MEPIRLTADDDGRTLDVSVGDVLVIELASTAGGYLWQPVVDDDATWTLVDSRPVDVPSLDAGHDAHIFGAPAKRRLTFEIQRSGSSTLRVENRRFNSIDPAVGSFTLVVAAQD